MQLSHDIIVWSKDKLCTEYISQNLQQVWESHSLLEEVHAVLGQCWASSWPAYV